MTTKAKILTNVPSIIELQKYIGERAMVDDAVRDLEYIIGLIEDDDREMHQLRKKIKEQEEYIKKLEARLKNL